MQSKSLKNWIQRNSATLLLMFVCFLLGGFLAIKTDRFLLWGNFVNILEANSYRLLLAMGMMVVIASGAIDLSAGSIVSLSAILLASALHANMQTWLSIVICLLAGALLGGVNGALVSITKINAFIITLATAFLYRGLSLIVTRGTPITMMPEDFRLFGYGDLFGMESGVIMALAILLILYPLFYKSKWGHYVSSLGGNAEALRRCGVSINKYRVSAFAVMGFLAALAGIIITARLNSAEANAGLNMEIDAICAVIMGGTALHGGKGNLWGTVIAVFLLGMIRNGLTLLSVSSYYQQFTTGAILLIAVLIAELKERRKRIAQ